LLAVRPVHIMYVHFPIRQTRTRSLAPTLLLSHTHILPHTHTHTHARALSLSLSLHTHTQTPRQLAESTAEVALLLMLGAARRLPEAVESVHSGQWSECWRPQWLNGRDLAGSTVGLVGLGDIGCALARLLAPFRCRLLYCGPREKPALAAALSAEYCSLESLLARSDFVSLHCPLTPATHHLIDHRAIALMRPHAVLVNTSRGSVVDHAALHHALTHRRLFAAGLDVTHPEPLPVDHPLLSLPNCLVLPHLGSATTRTRSLMASLAADNLIAGSLLQPLPNPLPPP
jgi:lactate dehydrogenase-like 2-hydroxyacid dehydrogenase